MEQNIKKIKRTKIDQRQEILDINLVFKETTTNLKLKKKTKTKIVYFNPVTGQLIVKYK